MPSPVPEAKLMGCLIYNTRFPSWVLVSIMDISRISVYISMVIHLERYDMYFYSMMVKYRNCLHKIFGFLKII